MITLFWIILSTIVVSTIGLIGVITLGMNEELLGKILTKLVALSTGALLGGAFLDLMPEGVTKVSPMTFFGLMLAAIIFYLLIEKVLHWRHCHKGHACETHEALGYMNLVGDAVHNFIDGMVIAATFIVSLPLGLITTVAIILHEIPQEIGDFGVMIYAGFSKKRAIFLHFMIALLAVAGGLCGWILAGYSRGIEKYLLPIAAAGFIYIAVSDLMPELRKGVSMKKFIGDFIFFLIGVAIIFVFTLANLK